MGDGMKKDYSVGTLAQQMHKRKIFIKLSKITFLSLLAFVSIGYFLLYVIYAKGNFIISLDKNMSNQKNIFLITQ